MKIEGTVVEIGDLEGFQTPTPGLRIERGNEIIEISGLSRDDIKALPNLLFKRVAINFDADTDSDGDQDYDDHMESPFAQYMEGEF